MDEWMDILIKNRSDFMELYHSGSSCDKHLRFDSTVDFFYYNDNQYEKYLCQKTNIQAKKKQTHEMIIN